MSVLAQPRHCWPTSPQPPIRWVEQKHARGCGFAALAMLTGQSYEAVVADFGDRYDPEIESPIWQHMDRYLALRGYALCRLFPEPLLPGEPQPTWPPAPFGAVHLCNVKMGKDSPCNHFVVMLASGRVLDPLRPDPRCLGDYYLVYNVAAVVPLKERFK